MSNDGRRLDRKTREQIRLRAVARVQAGESPEDVIQALGFHRSCIYEWLAEAREGGEEALKTRAITGRPRKLSAAQLNKLYHIITSKNPLQLKFSFALWTRGMVRELIRKEFGVRLCDASVGRLLHRLGLSPSKPLYRAYQQDAERVERWKREAYPDELVWNHLSSIRLGAPRSARWPRQASSGVFAAHASEGSLVLL